MNPRKINGKKREDTVKLKKAAMKSNRPIQMSESMLENKTIQDFIIDELTLPSAERKSRIKLINSIMHNFHCDRSTAYKHFNTVTQEVAPKMLFTKIELQSYLLEEYQAFITAEYEKDDYSGTAIVLALNGIQKLRENWIEVVEQDTSIPIPIMSSDPNALPNYDKKMDKQIKAFLGKYKDKVEMTPFLKKMAEDAEYTDI